jgi:hypothetical protein
MLSCRLTCYTESSEEDGRNRLSRNSAEEYDQTPNVTVSGKPEFVALTIDSDLPSLSIDRLSPLKLSENRKKWRTMWEVRAPVSDPKPEGLLPSRHAENLSTSWSYPETVE